MIYKDKIPTIKKLIHTLQNDDFKQCRGTLHCDDGYCCIGVAAVVLDIAKPQDMWVEIDENGEVDDGPAEVYNEVKTQLGYKLCDEAIAMNDDGKSFEEIAEFMYDQITKFEESRT